MYKKVSYCDSPKHVLCIVNFDLTSNAAFCHANIWKTCLTQILPWTCIFPVCPKNGSQECLDASDKSLHRCVDSRAWKFPGPLGKEARNTFVFIHCSHKSYLATYNHLRCSVCTLVNSLNLACAIRRIEINVSIYNKTVTSYPARCLLWPKWALSLSATVPCDCKWGINDAEPM